MRDQSTLLFSQYELVLVLEAQEKKIKELTSAVPAQVLVESNIDELVSSIENEVRVEPLQLLEDETNVEQTEVKVDVSQDFRRAIFDRSRPFHVDGVRVSYYVPFTGDKELLKCRPNAFSFNPPRARIAGSDLALDYDRADRDIASTKAVFAQDLSNVRQWIGNSQDQVVTFNSGLAAKIRQQLTARQQHLTANQQEVGDLGFKVRPKKKESRAEEILEGTQPVPKQRRRQQRKVAPEYDVALSFAGEDREYVERVAVALREARIKVFYDRFEEIDLWGKNLADHLGDVYSNSKYVVIFVSKHYAEKAWPNHERKHAQARALKNQEDIILPARFDDTKIPGLPDTVSYINLNKSNPEEFADKVIRKLAQSE